MKISILDEKAQRVIDCIREVEYDYTDCIDTKSFLDYA